MNPLLIRRRGMMQAQQGGLPYDAEIEFLEATGGAYIVLPHGISGDTDFSCDGIIPSASSNRFLIGSADGWEVSHVMIGSSGTYNYYLRYGTSATVQISRTYAAFGIRHTFSKNGLVYKWGNYTITGTNFTKTIQKTFLFAGTSDGTHALNAGMNITIYKFSMSDTNYQVDLIPVRVGTVGYMYDRVSGQLFGNDGTGSFVLGPDVI